MTHSHGLKSEVSKIRKDNWKKINSLMELRQKQFEDLYQENWWNYLIEDELYKHLCQKLAEIKLMGRPTFLVRKELSEKDIKNLASGFISVEDFVKDIKPFDDLEEVAVPPIAKAKGIPAK